MTATVLVGGVAEYGCTRRSVDVNGCEITTAEGLDPNGTMITAFIEEQAGQCGYCLTGILMSACALLARNSQPGRAEITAALDRHLCRCGAHGRIVRAVQRACGGSGINL